MTNLKCEIPDCESHESVRAVKVPPGIELLVCDECQEEFENNSRGLRA